MIFYENTKNSENEGQRAHNLIIIFIYKIYEYNELNKFILFSYSFLGLKK